MTTHLSVDTSVKGRSVRNPWGSSSASELRRCVERILDDLRRVMQEPEPYVRGTLGSEVGRPTRPTVANP